MKFFEPKTISRQMGVYAWILEELGAWLLLSFAAALTYSLGRTSSIVGLEWAGYLFPLALCLGLGVAVLRTVEVNLRSQEPHADGERTPPLGLLLWWTIPRGMRAMGFAAMMMGFASIVISLMLGRFEALPVMIAFAIVPPAIAFGVEWYAIGARYRDAGADNAGL